MSLILGTGRNRPPREIAIALAVFFAGALVAYLFMKAVDFALGVVPNGWRP